MDASSLSKHSESCTRFPLLPPLMLSCRLHSCPSPGRAVSRYCCSQQPAQHGPMPVRHFDGSANSLCVLWCSDLALRASNDVKNSSLLPTPPPFTPANFSEQIQGVLRGEKLYCRSSLGAEFRVFFSVSSWEEYLDYRSGFARQGFSCVCWMLPSGWASARTLPDFQPFQRR